MKQITLALIMVASFSCKSDDSIVPRPSCNPSANATFRNSTDASTSKAGLYAAGNSSPTSFPVDFKASTPSEIRWRIQGETLTFGEKTLAITYNDRNSSWDLTDDQGSIVGVLKPLNTDECLTVYRLDLSMFIPEESATARIAYVSL